MRGNFMEKNALPESFIIGTNQRFSDLTLPPWLASSGELRPSTLAQAESYKPGTIWEDADGAGKKQRRTQNLSPTSRQGRLTRKKSSKYQVHQGRAERESQNEAWPLRSGSLREHSRMWILERCPEIGRGTGGRTLHRASQAQLVGGPGNAGSWIGTKYTSIMSGRAK